MAFLDREGLQKVWAHMNSQINKKAEKNKEELTSYITEELGYYSNYVTPQMFGAKGDGVTDDTVAMQAAFDDVANNGKYLFIPKGRYKVTRPITIDWSRDSATKRNFLQKIVGAGSQAFEKYYDNSVIVGYNIPANRGVIELMGDGNTWGPQTRIEDLGIECDESTCDPMSFALKYGDARNFLLHRVKLKGHNTILARCGSIVDESGNSVTHGYEQINVKFVQCDFHVYESNTKGFAFLPEGVITGQHATMDNIVVDSCWSSGVWVIASVNIMFQSCQVCIPNVANKEITTNNVGKLNGYEIDYATGFYVGQAMSAVFQNCYFEDHRRSFHITPTLGSVRNVSIMNCYLNPGCNQFNADGSRLCADYGVLITPGTSSGVVRNVLVQNNVFRLVDGDTEFVVASVRNECAEHFVFRDNCTTSTLAVTKVENTTTSGYDIQNGKDSGASVKSMTTSADGKTLTIELTNGKSMTFNTGASAPIKGVDYFTEAEIEDITDNAAALAKADLQQIAPPTWVESVDDMTDTTKHYVLQESGNIWAYMKKTKTIPGGTTANFTNRIKDANAYVKNGYRYSHSSAAFKEQASDAAIVVPIPSASTYTFRTRGATYAGCTYPASVYFGTTNEAFSGAPINNAGEGVSYGTDDNGDTFITIYKPPTGTWNYAVFHVAKVTNVDALIVTVNEEITYTNTEASTETVSEWTDTGSYLGDTFATRQQFKPEFANSIEECTDQSKLYVLPDGYIYAYIATVTEGEKVPDFTNVMKSDGAYVKAGYRYSNSSAMFKACTTDDAIVIPISNGSHTIRVRGAGSGGSYTASFYYGDNNQTFGFVPNDGNVTRTVESNGDITITCNISSAITHCVFHVEAGVDPDTLIVTVDQEITYTTTPGSTVYQLVSTGHAFVPADYEGRIVANEQNISTLQTETKNLADRLDGLSINAGGSTENIVFSIPAFAPVPQKAPTADGGGIMDVRAIRTDTYYEYMDGLVAKHPNYLYKQYMGKDMTNTYDHYRYIACRSYYHAWVLDNYPKMFGWKNGNTVVYSVSVSPRVGDAMYSTPYIGTVHGTVAVVNCNFDPVKASTRTVGGVEFERYAAADVEPTVVYTTVKREYEGCTVYSSTFASSTTVSSIADGVMTCEDGKTYTRYPFEDRRNDKSKPLSIFILSNEHAGCNWGDSSIVSIIVAQFLTDLCENKNIPFLRWLKDNCMITTIPIGNPWGYSEDSIAGYDNGNAVNINRNYDTPGWCLGEYDLGTGHGEYAGSENETQHIMNTIHLCNADVGMSMHGVGHHNETPTQDGYIQMQGNGFDSSIRRPIDEIMTTSYNLGLEGDTTVVNDPYHAGKSPSYIQWAGAVGGLTETVPWNALTGEYFDSVSMEAGYTEMLLFLQCWIKEALQKAAE